MLSHHQKKISLLVANWKMNLPKDGIQDFFDFMDEKFSASEKGSEKIIIAPPFGYLSQVGLRTQKYKNWSICGQNAHESDHGVFTGEMSISMLQDLGAEYVILGHSERRRLFGETSSAVAKKTQKALEKGLIPIICIGESLEERQKQQTHLVLQEQLKPLEDFFQSSMMIAYEPVWAIGTAMAATAEDAASIHQFIRQYTKRNIDQLSILYGGSVNSENFGSFLDKPDISGSLVGGASLEKRSFLSMIKNIQNQ